MSLSIFPIHGRGCPLCKQYYGGSHYHCGKCGKITSYQGCYGSKDGGNTWGFSCDPVNVASWTKKMEKRVRLQEEKIEIVSQPNVLDITDELYSLGDDVIFDVIERLLDGQESDLIYRVQAHVKEITDRWEARDNA